MLKLYVVGSSIGYANWLINIGNIELTCSREEADIALFTGGEDVNPGLYKQKPHESVYYNSARDEYEIGYFNYFKDKNIPMIGICRGSQFLCVMAGGQLVQDSSHPYMHEITLSDGQTININSTHHQQALLTNLVENVDYELLGWANNLSKRHIGETQDYHFGEDYREPEIVWYPKIKSLGIQGHPESLFAGNKTHEFVETVKKFAIDKVFPCIPEKTL